MHEVYDNGAAQGQGARWTAEARLEENSQGSASRDFTNPGGFVIIE